MLRLSTLLVTLVFCLGPVIPERAEEKTMSDCEYWTGKMDMSKSSRAVGHVVNGRLTGENKTRCKYDVRFHLGGQLVVVKDMYGYELSWPSAQAKEVARTASEAASKSHVENLDFGG